MFAFQIKSAALVVTNQCNLRCLWCFEQPTSQEAPPTQGIFSLMDKLKDAEMLVITGGEPFTRKDIREILDRASKNFKKVHITTNGTQLTASDIAFLAEKKIGATVSMDGLKETHEKVRGTGTFEKVLQTIAQMVCAGVKVNLQMTLSSLNCKDARKIITLGELLGVERVSFLPMKIIGKGTGFEKNCLDKAERKKICEKIGRERKNWKVDVIFKSSLANTINRELETLSKRLGAETVCAGCKAGMAGIFVEWNGDVFPCPFLRIKIGNLFEQDLQEIWQGSTVLNKLRERNSIQDCSSCRYWAVCRGCRADALAATGNYLGKDPFCWRTKSERTNQTTRKMIG